MENINLKRIFNRLLGEKGLTQNQIARSLNMSQSSVSKVLRGRQKTISHLAFIKLQKLLQEHGFDQ